MSKRDDVRLIPPCRDRVHPAGVSVLYRADMFGGGVMTALVILGWTVVYLTLRVPFPVALVLAINSSMYHFVEMPKKPRYVDLNKLEEKR